MKRTREWWAGLRPTERSRLVLLEGAGGLIPDDCYECGFCGTPHSGTGLCPPCREELVGLINKADSSVAVLARMRSSKI